VSDQFKKVGSLLRQKREELSLSLKEVESSTGVRSAYLEAIEEGNIAQFVSSIYALGFMKQYASMLGVDLDRMIRENPSGFKLPSEKHDFSFGIGTLEVRGNASGGVRWLPNLLWAGAAASLLALGLFLAKYIGIFGAK